MAVEKFSGKFSNEVGGMTCLLNSVLQSVQDFAVLGLYCYLASKPDNWKPNAKELMTHSKSSKDKMYRLINGLIAEGLMTVKEIREKGKFSYYEYTVHLHKQTRNHSKDAEISPCPEKPDAVKPDAVFQDAYKEKNLEKKEVKNTTTEAIASNSSNSEESTKEQKKLTQKAKDDSMLKEILETYHRVLPNSPKIRIPSDDLRRLVKIMANKWPELNGNKFSLERFESYLTLLKKHCPKFIEPYQTATGRRAHNNLETFIRFNNIIKTVDNQWEWSN